MTTRTFTRKEREVWQACEALWQDGLSLKELTGDTIGNKLINLGFLRGSNSDIHRYKKTWIESKGFDKHDAASHVQLITPLSDPISRAAATLAHDIKAEAVLEMSKLKEEYEAKLQTILEQYQASQNQVKGLEDQLEMQQSISNELRFNLTSLEQQHQDIKIRYAGLEERAEQTNQQLLQSQREYQVYLEQIKQAQESMQLHWKNQVDQLIQAHQKEIREFQQSLEQLRHKHILEIDAFQTRQTKLDKDLAKAEQSLQHKQQSLVDIERQLTKKEEYINELQIECKQTHEKLNKLQREVETRACLLKEAEHRAEEYQQQLLLSHQSSQKQQELISSLEKRLVDWMHQLPSLTNRNEAPEGSLS